MNCNEDCLFCRFAKTGEKDGQTLYENNLIYVMLDDFPISKGHSLIISKEHISDISYANIGLAHELGETSALIGKALMQSLNPDKIYIASLNEEVEHLHFHIVPRYEGGRKGFDHFKSGREKLENRAELTNLIRAFI